MRIDTDDSLKLILDIEPKPQSRPRFARRGSFVSAYETKEMKFWKQACSDLIAEECLVDELITCALKVDLKFYIKPPKYISDKKKNVGMLIDETIPVAKKPDIDNYIKAVLDVSNGLLFKDDGQVVEIKASKYYSNNPRIEYTLQEV